MAFNPVFNLQKATLLGNLIAYFAEYYFFYNDVAG